MYATPTPESKTAWLLKRNIIVQHVCGMYVSRGSLQIYLQATLFGKVCEHNFTPWRSILIHKYNSSCIKATCWKFFSKLAKQQKYVNHTATCDHLHVWCVCKWEWNLFSSCEPVNHRSLIITAYDQCSHMQSLPFWPFLGKQRTIWLYDNLE